MAQEREVLVSVRDLEIKFKDFVAVSDVNFDIYKGETFSLVGESGSGKTTIGRAIIRINETSKGDILFKGKKINGKITRDMNKYIVKNIQKRRSNWSPETMQPAKRVIFHFCAALSHF